MFHFTSKSEMINSNTFAHANVSWEYSGDYDQSEDCINPALFHRLDNYLWDNSQFIGLYRPIIKALSQFLPTGENCYYVLLSVKTKDNGSFIDLEFTIKLAHGSMDHIRIYDANAFAVKKPILKDLL